MKGKPSEWEKIFSNNISDKGLISKMYSIHTIQKKKTHNLFKIWEVDLSPNKTNGWPKGTRKVIQ